ncbi:hypothetical protein ACFC1R_17715 [Kitasatospora sp. NPDC056138]
MTDLQHRAHARSSGAVAAGSATRRTADGVLAEPCVLDVVVTVAPA